MIPVVLGALAFVLGSIPFGFVVVRTVAGRDIRETGSGNIGATNVGRVLGPWGWALTLVADAGKGAAPVLLAAAVMPQRPGVAAAAAFLAILGHCYTPWLGGKGGKGVATMLGAFAVLAPGALLAAVVGFALVAAAARYVSLASMVASLVLVIACWWLRLAPATIAAAAGTLLLVLWRHRANLVRLLRGTEARIGGRA